MLGPVRPSAATPPTRATVPQAGAIAPAATTTLETSDAVAMMADASLGKDGTADHENIPLRATQLSGLSFTFNLGIAVESFRIA